MGVYDYHHDSGRSDRPGGVPVAEHVQETQTISPYKAYVEVIADFSADGQMKPLRLIWEDGRKYDVDRILRVDRCAASRREAPESAMFAGFRGSRWNCIMKKTDSGLSAGKCRSRRNDMPGKELHNILRSIVSDKNIRLSFLKSKFIITLSETTRYIYMEEYLPCDPRDWN